MGDGVGFAVIQCFLTPADDGSGAHGAEGDAHGVGVVDDLAAGRGGGLIVLGHGVAHTGPEIDVRGFGNDLRVDENVVGRNLGEGVLPQTAVGMIHDKTGSTANREWVICFSFLWVS